MFHRKSHREIDESILGLDAGYSRGYQTMGILHHLGLKDKHKGFFEQCDISQAITLLKEQNYQGFKEFILALVRFNDSLYSEDDLDLFIVNTDIKTLIKNVGSSQYTDGVRIEKEFHDIFNPPQSSFYSSRGSARTIKVLFNNKVFDAEYRYEGQKDKKVDLQSIRFKKELKEEFKIVFPECIGQFKIQVGQTFNHFIFSHMSVIVEDGYGDDSEYDETREVIKQHKIRERKPELIRKAKEVFMKKNKRLFCEICGFDFVEKYGDRGFGFIEGHHVKPVSELKYGDKTKIEDIRLLCSNCHSIIHKKPFMTVEELRQLINEN